MCTAGERDRDDRDRDPDGDPDLDLDLDPDPDRDGDRDPDPDPDLDPDLDLDLDLDPDLDPDLEFAAGGEDRQAPRPASPVTAPATVLEIDFARRRLFLVVEASLLRPPPLWREEGA